MQAEKAETGRYFSLNSFGLWLWPEKDLRIQKYQLYSLHQTNFLLLELEFAPSYLYRALVLGSSSLQEISWSDYIHDKHLRIPSQTFAFLRRPRSSGWRKGKGNENRPFEIDPSCWKSCHVPCGVAWYGLMHPDSILSLKTYHGSRKSGGNLAGIQHRKPAFNGQKNHATLPLPHRTLKVHLVLRHNAQSAWPLNPCTLEVRLLFRLLPTKHQITRCTDALNARCARVCLRCHPCRPFTAIQISCLCCTSWWKCGHQKRACPCWNSSCAGWRYLANSLPHFNKPSSIGHVPTTASLRLSEPLVKAMRRAHRWALWCCHRRLVSSPHLPTRIWGS